MPLSNYCPWKLANECIRISGVVVKCFFMSSLGKIKYANLLCHLLSLVNGYTKQETTPQGMNNKSTLRAKLTVKFLSLHNNSDCVQDL